MIARRTFPMREQLDALVSELRRLRRDGVTRVVVSEESLNALKQLAATTRTGAPSATAPESGQTAPPPVKPEPAPAASAPAAPRASAPTRAPEEPPARVEEPAPPPRAIIAPKTPEIAPMPAPPRISLPEGDRAARLDALRERMLSDPAALARLAPGKSPVAFDGAPDAPVLFLIPMPGPDDGREGRALAGAEGELYGKIVAAMGLPRPKVCTATLLPYRPETPDGHGHREPLPDELAYFLPHFRALVATVSPRVIVALGGGARDALFGKGPPISKSRGEWLEFDGVPVMPTYHISYLIRNNTNRSKRIVWEDMLAVMGRLGLPVSERQRGYFL